MTEEKKSAGGRPAHILAEAAKLFSQRGFAATSMQDLGQACGVTKSALYHFFKDKEALIERMAIDTMQGLIEAVEAEVAQAHGPREQLVAFCRAHARFQAAHLDEFVAITLGFGGRQLPFRSPVVTLRDRYEQMLHGILESGMASGDFRNVQPAFTTRAILSSINGTARWWKPEGAASLEDVTMAYIELFLNGLLASPAAEFPAPAKKTVSRKS